MSSASSLNEREKAGEISPDAAVLTSSSAHQALFDHRLLIVLPLRH